MITANPLAWPPGWPRSGSTEYSRLARYSFGRARDEVYAELERLGATDVIISSNLKLRLDGIPAAGQRQPEDAGIAVYFKLEGNDQCIPCDKWSTVEQNLRAIAKTIEALRGIERWGAKSMVDAAFKGFKALPAPIVTARTWYEIIGVSPFNPTFAEVETRYKAKLHLVHPDKGGSEQAFIELQNAFEEAKEFFK